MQQMIPNGKLLERRYGLISDESKEELRNEEKIDLKDDAYILEFYNELWDGENHNYTSMVEKVLKLEKLWGCDLSNIDGLLKLTSFYLNEIDNEGIKKML